MKHHGPHHRERRWPESTHVFIASAITIALLVGIVVLIGKNAPPAERSLSKPAPGVRLLEK